MIKIECGWQIYLAAVFAAHVRINSISAGACTKLEC